TTALLALHQALRRWDPSVRTVYFGNARSPLAGLDTWTERAVTAEQAAEVATRLAGAGFGDDPAPLAVFVEAPAEFVNGVADLPLQHYIRAAIDAGALVIGEGETSTLVGSYPLQQLLKNHRAGIALQPDQVDGTSVYRTSFPRSNRADFPPGRGFLVRHGRT